MKRLREEASLLYRQLPLEEQDPRRLSRLLHGPTLRLKADEANVTELLGEVRTAPCASEEVEFCRTK